MSFTSIADLRNYINQKIYINTVGEIEADAMNSILQGICDYLASTANVTFYVVSFRIGDAGKPAAGYTQYEDNGLYGRTILSFTRDGANQNTTGDTPYTFNPTYNDPSLSNPNVGLINVGVNNPFQNKEVITIVAT